MRVARRDVRIVMANENVLRRDLNYPAGKPLKPNNILLRPVIGSAYFQISENIQIFWLGDKVLWTKTKAATCILLIFTSCGKILEDYLKLIWFQKDIASKTSPYPVQGYESHVLRTHKLWFIIYASSPRYKLLLVQRI